MITAEAMKPLGQAIKDFYAGDVGAEVAMHRDDGAVSGFSISALFRGPFDFQVDRVMLDHCSGTILDIGAGAGIHSLYLQQRGYDVTALDVSKESCQVMKRRGIKHIICGSISELKAGTYDTLLILGRSISMVETLAGLDEFLKNCRSLVNPGGQILLNSLDVAKTRDPVNIAYHKANRRAGKYIGEIRLHLEYKGMTGPETGFLHVDDGTLAAYAATAGWDCRILLRESDGHYAAQLTKVD